MKEQIIITVNREKYKEMYGITLPANDMLIKALNPHNINNEAFSVEIKTLED